MNYNIIKDSCNFKLEYSTMVTHRPLPKQSTRFAKGHSYTPKKLQEYTAFLQGWWTKTYDKPALTGPLRIQLCYCFPYIKDDDHLRKQLANILHVKKVDVDNLGKNITDSMEGYIFKNDKQICFLECCKVRRVQEGIGIQVYSVLQEFGGICKIWPKGS